MAIDPEDGPAPKPERTAIQPQAAIAASKGLSVPEEVAQHAFAPEIPGYILTKVLGRGAFAEVWKAWQVRTHKWVAVKVFTQRNGINWIFLQREVERLIKLDKHPHIVSLLDADLMGAPAYYVMDFLERGSLDQFVHSATPAPPEKAAKWMEEIAEALAYVHSKGLIHCDLKPANILLDEEGHVRVADFGQSRIVTDSAGALGTLYYMAPEQSAATKDGAQVQPDVRWDVYGLGTTMWAVLTGKVPHGDEDNRKLLDGTKTLEERLKVYRETVCRQPLADPSRVTRGKVDEDLSAIVAKCASAETTSRHRTVAEVLADLKARHEHRPVSPLAHEKKYRIRHFLERNLKLVALSTAAALALLVAGAQLSRKNAALERAGKSLALKDRALREAEAEVERKNAALQQQLAESFAARGAVHFKAGDFAAAASFFAESNRLSPTHRARANALAALAEMGAGAARTFRPDGRFALTGGGEPARAVAFSPDGRTALTGGSDRTARLWDARTGVPFGRRMRHQAPVEAVAFSPDAMTVLTGSSDGAAQLWDARTGEPFGRRMSHQGPVEAAAFSPDAMTLLTGSSDGAAQLWDARTGVPLGTVLRHEGTVEAIAFSPDGKTALTGSADAAVHLWDARTGEPTGTILRHGGPVSAVAFSPDGASVLSGSEDKTARLWDARTGEPRGKALRHEDGVRAVAFSPDGKTALTVGADAAARLWDATTGEPIGQVRRGVSAAAFSPDGKTVLIYPGMTNPLWDVAWLAEPADADALQLRTDVGAKMRINASGDLETIPDKEWRFLHAKLSAQTLPGAEAAAPPPDRPVPPGFHKSVTRHFTVFAEEVQAPDRFLGLIEKLHGDMMRDLEPFSPWASDRKVEIFLFKSKDAYRRVTGRPPWSGGAASVQHRTVYLYDTPEMPSLFANLLGSVYYDGFYLGGHDAPLWLSSGMATYLQAERGGGVPPWLRENLERLERGGGFASEELMSRASTKGLSGDQARLWHAQSYCIARFLNRAPHKGRFYKFSQYLREGTDPTQALARDYGLSFQALDDAWRADLADTARSKPARGDL